MEEERKQEKEKHNSTELQNPTVEADAYNNSKTCDWRKNKDAQKLN